MIRKFGPIPHFDGVHSKLEGLGGVGTGKGLMLDISWNTVFTRISAAPD